jgi:hypothetical protein
VSSRFKVLVALALLALAVAAVAGCGSKNRSARLMPVLGVYAAPWRALTLTALGPLSPASVS